MREHPSGHPPAGRNEAAGEPTAGQAGAASRGHGVQRRGFRGAATAGTSRWRRQRGAGGAQGLLPTAAGDSSERGARVCTVAAARLGPDRGVGSERSAGVRGVSA